MRPNIPVDHRPFWPEVALIWGAGASTSLGLPTTAQIGKIISILAGVYPYGERQNNTPLKERIDEAFKGWKLHPVILRSFRDLLLVLYDGDGAKSPEQVMRNHKKHVRKVVNKYCGEFSIPEQKRIEVGHYFDNLHHVYDWNGVRSVARYIARKWEEKKAKRGELIYRDLLTTIDQLVALDMAMPTEELFYRKGDAPDRIYLIDKHRLLGVQRCIAHLTSTIQRMVVQVTPAKLSKKKLTPYWKFAEVLADLMHDESQAFYNRGYKTDERQFYYYTYSFISFNWDPIMAWLIFHAHKKINDTKPRIGSSVLRLFNDSGDGIGIRKISDKEDRGDENLLAFMMNESTCKRINDPKYQGGKNDRLVRVGKMLFPHAGLGWRICARCGKLFTDFGPNLDDLCSTVAFGPDLLPDINRAWRHRTKIEAEYQEHGECGVIQCIFCGSVTRPYDSPLILQSGIKAERHYVMEGIFRELGLVVGNARHIIFAGYSLPKDDYIYRCFLQSSWAGQPAEQRKGNRFCTLISHDPAYAKRNGFKPWLYEKDILAYLGHKTAKTESKTTIRNLLELFDIKDIRVSLLGFPNIVTDHRSKNLREATIDLLYPRHCFAEGFPIKHTRGANP